MRRAVRVASVIGVLSCTSALAQEAALLKKFKDWSAYAATGSPQVCFIVAQPTASLPKNVKRGPIYFYISRYPADQLLDEIGVKIAYPFAPGAKTTVTIGTDKFELFTKEEGAFVEKTEDEGKLLEAMKGGTT